MDFPPVIRRRMPLYLKIIGFIGLAMLLAGTINLIYFGYPFSRTYQGIQDSYPTEQLSGYWYKYNFIGWSGEWTFRFYRKVPFGQTQVSLRVNGQEVYDNIILIGSQAKEFKLDLKLGDMVTTANYSLDCFTDKGIVKVEPPEGKPPEKVIRFVRKTIPPCMIIGLFVSIFFVRFVHSRFHAFRWTDEKKEMRMKRIARHKESSF